MSSARLSSLAAIFPDLSPRRLAALAAAAIAIVAFWFTPMSPSALGPADAAVGRGEPERAVVLYDRVASYNPLPWLRDEALYRGAMILALDMREPTAARLRLQRLAENLDGNDPVKYAEIQARIAGLYTQEGLHTRAAEAWERSWAADPEAWEAEERLVGAAESRRRAEDAGEADRVWARVADLFPDREGDARIAQAEIRFGADDAAGALRLYEEALVVAPTAELRRMARLGVAACRERLGDLEGAIADLDDGDLPEPILERRREALRARLSLNQGAE